MTKNKRQPESQGNPLQLENVNLPLGRVVATRGIAEAIGAGEDNPSELQGMKHAAMRQAITRHRRGDWGDVGEDDWEANNNALAFGERILSSYFFPNGRKFWIITEHDRSLTTVLFPSEY